MTEFGMPSIGLDPKQLQELSELARQSMKEAQIIQSQLDRAGLSHLFGSRAKRRQAQLQTDAQKELGNQIAQIAEQLGSNGLRIDPADTQITNLEGRLKTAEDELKHLRSLVTLRAILEKTDPNAHGPILASNELRQLFTSGGDAKAHVMAIDVRRSTELMLKASSSAKFADFIGELCDSIKESIFRNFGVFDKFTGDGVLAYFPDVYSGPNAHVHCLRAAVECHQSFEDIYRKHHGAFRAILVNTGLGIGIDYGEVQVCKMAGELTVVGIPVVYACRLSGSPAGATFLNQAAFQRAKNHQSIDETWFEECRHNIKGDGEILVHRLLSTNLPAGDAPTHLLL